MKEEMMNQLAEAVKKVVGTECDVHFRKVEKNNGLVLQSVEIREPETRVLPVIYIDGILKRIESGDIRLQDAADEIVGFYRKNNNAPERIQSIVSSFSRKYILERVVYQMINREMNAERLEDMPHKELLDLAAVYKVIVSENTLENASITVSWELCKKFAITEKELDTAAKRNTEVTGFRMQSIESVLAEIMDMPEEISCQGLDVWVISNTTRFNGAAAMLYNSCFDSLAEKLGSDLYVLPSSVHEVLAVPTRNMDSDTLRDMVCSINANEVAVDEVLSNNIYKYNRKDGILSIA